MARKLAKILGTAVVVLTVGVVTQAGVEHPSTQHGARASLAEDKGPTVITR